MNRHVNKTQLLALAFGDFSCGGRQDLQRHLQSCSQCGSSLDTLHLAVSEMGRRPLEEPSPFVWTKIKARIERSAVEENWSEPSWMPIIGWHLGGIGLMITLILWLGSWLEAAAVRQPFLAWISPGHLSPYSLAVMLVFTIGALLTLAITPLLWWESNPPQPTISGNKHLRM